MAEAEHFEATQELPNGFNEETSPSPQKAPRKGKAGKGRGKKGEQILAAGKNKKRANLDESVIKQRSHTHRFCTWPYAYPEQSASSSSQKTKNASSILHLYTSDCGCKVKLLMTRLPLCRSVKERQEGILQALVLAPPPESPYSHQPCLKGVRKLLEMKKAGLWPAPPPKPQPILQQPGFLQYHGMQMSQPPSVASAVPTQVEKKPGLV